MGTSKLYTDEEFTKAVASSMSMAETLRSVGLVPNGANYTVAKSRIKRLSLSTEHWTGAGHMRGKKGNVVYSVPLEEVLTENSQYSSGALKRRLIKAGLLPYECKECLMVDWRGKPISLHLDHINGVHDDNRLENLRLLCPNCHSQTPTYAGKKLRKTRGVCKSCSAEVGSTTFCGMCRGVRQRRTWVIPTCPDCGGQKSATGVRCRKCASKLRVQQKKITWPTVEELVARIQRASFLVVSEELGVSDNGLRKHLKLRGIDVSSLDGRKKKVFEPLSGMGVFTPIPEPGED